MLPHVGFLFIKLYLVSNYSRIKLNQIFIDSLSRFLIIVDNRG